MKICFFFLFIIFCTLSTKPANAGDWDWWNELHGWQQGDPGWRSWMKIAPGYMGPNALPVPEVKKGFIPAKSEFELIVSNHFSEGDPTQDISAKLFLPYAKNKIAFEMWGVMFEHFAFSEEIRNERVARNKDGKGNAVGDFYFSTLIQISKDRKFPNTLLRLATKTASGTQLESARYTDSPGYFFDVSFSNDFGRKQAILFRPFGLAGFYAWQTNIDNCRQDDAFLYAMGAEFIKDGCSFSGSFSGYSGYISDRDKPMQLNFDIRKDFGDKAFRLQYIHGLRDWEYKTVRFSFVWKFKGIG